jgi:hypothetical protein
MSARCLAPLFVALVLLGAGCAERPPKTERLVVELDPGAAPPPDGAERELERAVASIVHRLDASGVNGARARREGHRVLVDVLPADRAMAEKIIARTVSTEIVIDGRTTIRGQIDRAMPDWDAATKKPFVSVRLGDAAAAQLASSGRGPARIEIRLEGEVQASFEGVVLANPLRLDAASERQAFDAVNALRLGALSTPLVVR